MASDHYQPKPPIITPQLIEYLEQRFPDQCPSPEMTEREIWISVGAVKVIRHLRHVLNEQEKSILEI